MSQTIEAWLAVDAEPRDLYEMLGKRVFDPNEGELLAAIRAATREAMALQNHRDGSVAEQAIRWQNELGRAEGILSDPAKRAQYDNELFGRIRGEFSRLPAFAKIWTSAQIGQWLTCEQRVHSDRAGAVATALADPTERSIVFEDNRADQNAAEADTIDVDVSVTQVNTPSPTNPSKRPARAPVFSVDRPVVPRPAAPKTARALPPPLPRGSTVTKDAENDGFVARSSESPRRLTGKKNAARWLWITPCVAAVVGILVFGGILLSLPRNDKTELQQVAAGAADHQPSTAQLSADYASEEETTGESGETPKTPAGSGLAETGSRQEIKDSQHPPQFGGGVDGGPTDGALPPLELPDDNPFNRRPPIKPPHENPREPVNPFAKTIPARFLSADSVMAMSVRPANVLASPLVKSLTPEAKGQLDAALIRTATEAMIDLRQVEQLLMTTDGMSHCAVLSLRAPLDETQWAQRRGGFEVDQYQTVRVFRQPVAQTFFCLPRPNLLIWASSQDEIKAALDRAVRADVVRGSGDSGMESGLGGFGKGGLGDFSVDTDFWIKIQDFEKLSEVLKASPQAARLPSRDQFPDWAESITGLACSITLSSDVALALAMDVDSVAVAAQATRELEAMRTILKSVADQQPNQNQAERDRIQQRLMSKLLSGRFQTRAARIDYRVTVDLADFGVAKREPETLPARRRDDGHAARPADLTARPQTGEPDSKADSPVNENKREAEAAKKLNVAKLLLGSFKHERAERLFQEIIDNYPETNAAAEARHLLQDL